MLVRTLFGGGSLGCVPDGERSLVGAVSRGRLPDEEHFPYFTLLFMDRPATIRSSAPSSHTSTPRTAPPAPSQPIWSPCGKPRSCLSVAPAWRPPPAATSRRSGGPALPPDGQHRRHVPQGPQGPPRLAGRRKEKAVRR